MALLYKNLVFSGGGVLGIAYLGLLDYFNQINLLPNITRVAGTSAGAITACIAAFNLPFDELKAISDTLDYSKVPGNDDNTDNEDTPSRLIPQGIKAQLNKVFDNVDCVYRLIKSFGWYSSSYFYDWIKIVIAAQFDAQKKQPPYTFADFQNPSLHKQNKVFKELYIVGTDISRSTSTVFSYKDTPDMEVAEAVRISMSVPLLFEAIKSTCDINGKDCIPKVYTDGGLLYNYPINIFDTIAPPNQTLGAYFQGVDYPKSINNLVDFISCTISCATSIQSQLYQDHKSNLMRSIPIHTSDISALNFSIATGDETYKFLYEQGFHAAEIFFSLL